MEYWPMQEPPIEDDNYLKAQAQAQAMTKLQPFLMFIFTLSMCSSSPKEGALFIERRYTF